MKNPLRSTILIGAAVSLALLAAAFLLPDSPREGPTQPGPEEATVRQSRPADVLDLGTQTAPANSVARSVSRSVEAASLGAAIDSDGDGRSEGEGSASGEHPGLVTWLNENPLSPIPHEVIRAWGGGPGGAGPIGLRIVVDPNLPTVELEELLLDVRTAYGAADVLSTHIYDSEEAATYDRHIDGGALAALHLVARVVRDTALEVDTIQIRGLAIEP